MAAFEALPDPGTALSPEILTWASPAAIRVELCAEAAGGLSGAALYRRLFEQVRGAESVTLEHSAGQLTETGALEAIAQAQATGARIELVTRCFHQLAGDEIEALASSPLASVTADLNTLDPAAFASLHSGGALERMQHNLAYFRTCQEAVGRQRPVLNFSYTASKRNADQLPAVAECAWRWRVYTVLVHGGATCDAALRRRVNRALEEARARWPRIRFEAGSELLEQPAPLSAAPAPYPDPLPRAARIFGCTRSPWDTLTVRSGGRVTVCERQASAVLGDLAEESVEEIWRSERYRVFRGEYQAGAVEECNCCPWKSLYRPGALSSVIQPGASDQAQLARGWYPADGGLAWARGQATAVLSGRDNPTHVRMEGFLPAGSNEANTLLVECGGHRLGAVTNAGRELRHFCEQLPLGPARRGHNGTLVFDFHAAEPWLPAENGGEDYRRLGFALISLSAQWRSETESTAVKPTPPGSRVSALPLYAALRLGEAFQPLGKWMRRKRAVPLEWGRGVSIIVPERATPERLGACLSSAFAAAEAAGEPFEIIVSLNGASLGDYADSMAQFPDARWLRCERPLGYAGAVRRGLAVARYSGVYLLNSDMTLHRQALVEALRWRGPLVAAVSSQILFEDASRRREETGWPGARVRDRRLEVFEAEPEDADAARSGLYASGGSALVHGRLLRRWMGRFDPYHPFYWKDADWGIRAWRAGYQVVFCPRSVATHGYRATIAKLYSPEEIQRISERNAWLFALRHGFDAAPARRIAAEACFSDPETRREMTDPRRAWSILKGRWEAARAVMPRLPVERLGEAFVLRPFRPGRPRILVVTPFAVWPPTHGGARRIVAMLKTLGETYDIILLSDEPTAYRKGDLPKLEGVAAVHLVNQRRVDDPKAALGRIERIAAHCHEGMAEATGRWAAFYDAALVQVEYIELAGLVEKRRGAAPWFITLHDALFGEAGGAEADRCEARLLAGFDGVFACSAEDARLTPHRNCRVVPNGVEPPSRAYTASEGSRTILFTGPFRYRPNFDGVAAFLERVYPELKRRVPEARLEILAGEGGAIQATGIEAFSQPGVSIEPPTHDPGAYLERCAVTINPITGIRGSSVKLIESIGHGRVCISTHEGARGFTDAGLPGLVQVQRVEDFLDPLVELLTDEPRRIGLESPPPNLAERFGWERSARMQVAAYRRLMG